MTLSKTHKRLITVFFSVAAALLFCINALLLYVVTGPRSLNAITPYIETALAPPGGDYKVKIESSELSWDGWRRPVAIHVKNVEVINGKGAVIAYFPEIGVSLYFFELLIGTIDLKSLEVMRPTALLIQGDDGNFSFGFSKAENAADNSLAAAFALITADKDEQPLTHLKSLIIRHATLSVKKAHGDVFLQSPDASLEIVRRHGSAKGALNMPLKFGDQTGEIDADLSIGRDDKTISAEVVYTDIPSTILHDLFPNQQWSQTVHMPLNGWAHVTSDFNANISTLDFMMDMGPGTIEYPSQFEAPLSLQRIHVEGGLTDKLSKLEVKKGVLDFKTFKIGFSGKVDKQADDYALDGNAELANVPVDDLHRYWPLSLSPHTRKWVSSRVHKGSIGKATVKVQFKHGEMALKQTPPQAIDATLEVKNATMLYMPKHPPVSDITGLVHFTGNSMDAKVSHAKYMTGTEVSSGKVNFPDLNAADVRLFLDMDLKAPAKDVVEFMSLPDLDKARRLNLTPAVTGDVSGSAKLDFIAFSEHEDSKSSGVGHINYAIAANLMNVSQPAFMGKRDINDATMKIEIDNKGIRADGKAKINQLPMNIKLTTSFARGDETNYAVKVDMPVARLHDFDMPALDFAKGSMGVDATFISSDTVDKASATLDLTQTAITMADHGYVKKIGDKATLKIATQTLASGNTEITSFALTGSGYSASGKAEFDKAAGDFSKFTFDTLKLGGHDLAYLDYAKIPDGIMLKARGRSFDASPYLQKPSGKSATQSYSLDINTDRLILGDKREMNNVSVQVDCVGTCTSASITAKLSSGTPFNYTLSGGKLNASCDNAGELIRTLGIFSGIDGGNLLLKGDYAAGKLSGKLLIKDYTIKNAPVLTKIFTIASLTGIMDTLSGKGIAFVRFLAPFEYEHGKILLKEAKAHGPALGITTDGLIDMSNSQLDLKGTLVPSYTMNSLVGNVPLIGVLLTGGKGKGLIAINYSVKGAMADPAISVNPLSAFTPGFLRGVFDIFDEPAPDLDKIEAEQKKAEEKQKQDKKSDDIKADPKSVTPVLKP